MPTFALQPGINVSTALTIAELFDTITEDELREQLLSSLRSRGFPVTDWYAGSVGRTLVETFSSALVSALTGDPAESNGLIEQIASSGFVDFAALLDGSTVERRWLTILAFQLYDLTRFAPSRTTGTVNLTCASGAGPVTITNRQLTFQAFSGNRYVGPTQAGPLVLPDGGTLTFTVESEFENNSTANPARNYVDASGTISGPAAMITVIPGVTASNAAPDFTTVSHQGPGTGTVTPSRTIPANPLVASSVKVLIGGDGQVGAGGFSYSLNGGAFVSGGIIPATFDIPATNIRMTFANGALNPSFRTNDTYYFETPGTWIVTQGTDEESNTALASRCRARWPDLADVPTQDVLELWARLASSQVTQVRVRVSTVVPGLVLVTIAGQAGALPQSTVDIVQDYIDDRLSLTDRVQVSSATPTVITIAGTVTVETSKVLTAQVAVQSATQNYINSVGGAGIVRVAGEIEAIMTQDGVIDTSGITINGGGNLQLGDDSVASFTQILATTLTWIGV